MLSFVMVFSVFTIVPITASAAEKELTETFNLGEYGHYDEDWEEVLADAHTGVNVTVSPPVTTYMSKIIAGLHTMISCMRPSGSP